METTLGFRLQGLGYIGHIVLYRDFNLEWKDDKLEKLV